MKEFLIILEEKDVFVFEKGGKKVFVAKIAFPSIENKVFLPVSYPVFSGADEKIGEIHTWLPEKSLFRARVNNYSVEIIEDSDGIKMKKKDLMTGIETVFEVVALNLKDFSQQEAADLKEFGFVRGLRINRNEKVGEINFFERDKQRRALLKIFPDFSWQDFFILAVLEEIKRQLKGKEVAEETIMVDIPPKAKPKVIYKEKEENQIEEVTPINFDGKGNYRDFVASFPAVKKEKAVGYINQAGEWEIFCDFMDNGKPMVVNGPTGNGKSTMIKWYAHLRDLPYFKYTGHRDTTMKDMVGLWIPTNQKPIKAPGPLILALVQGGIFHFEEIGPVSQEVLDGIHTVLDDREIFVDSQFGFEMIKAHPEFRIVASGNLNRNYTMNEFSDAFLERWSQIRIGYPDKEKTIEIITSVAGVDAEVAKTLTDITFSMREFLFQNYQMDMGLRGAVEVAETYLKGSVQSLPRLIEVCMINPKATYDESDLRKKLREIVGKVLGVSTQPDVEDVKTAIPDLENK